MGFADAARAELLLLNDLGTTAAELRTDPLVTAIAAAADPDLALTGMARLFAAATRKDALRAALRAEQDFRDRLTAVLGVSAGLADHLARHPEDAEILRGTVSRPDPAELRADMLRAVGADPDDPESPTAAGAGARGRAGRGLPAQAAAPRGARPDRGRDRRCGGRGTGRHRGRGPRGGARRGPGRTAARRGAVPAGRGGHGQVRRP